MPERLVDRTTILVVEAVLTGESLAKAIAKPREAGWFKLIPVSTFVAPFLPRYHRANKHGRDDGDSCPRFP